MSNWLLSNFDKKVSQTRKKNAMELTKRNARPILFYNMFQLIIFSNVNMKLNELSYYTFIICEYEVAVEFIGVS